MNAAVIGLGYVGLPLSIRLAQTGFGVLGIDKDQKKIELLGKNLLPFGLREPNLLSFFKQAQVSKNLKFTSTYEEIKDVDIIFISVDTPVEKRQPDIASLLAATKSIAKHLKKNQIIVIESTVAPKTTQDLIIPLLEKLSKLKLNRDFFVAVVPERIRPNYIFKQLTTLPRVIGVSDLRIKKELRIIYSKITTGKLNFTDLATAEVVKTVENAYRDVNIAFANEIALACEDLGVDVWKIRELVNKSPWRDMHKPGSGVGGHCIPKDPWLLASSVKKHQMRLIETARSINDNMPAHIFALAEEALKEKKIKIASANLAILGYAYVGNSDDTRNSPTESLIQILKNKKVKYKVHDPYVKDFSNHSVEMTAKGADVLIIMVNHDVYKKINYKKVAKVIKTKIIIDGRNLVPAELVRKLGFVYKGVGNTS
ncbi:hypothetical protein A3D81_01075 [Candidatus Curtissbacteria bacterium RIFCSPHIGHO2_02_FULL_40_17]|uniref:UDP-glucose/GDP-mannose dehydrogenase C-terminal domain-containing protein n=4 Tax=Candidatus Curtissiibacteriota TaxID=1752717 RepID=A0A1F5GHP8_9BACT|nr:MAG: hypothetical protein A2693_03250 [Candidatus Curtissbacteria bacterium RIFCSPHIGHO2_01_FULL_40_12]OGD91375.1 MAG: hypothetical protein A3D81_01075 [Candidatus Curtissbacteria bacterium RIFCSPHIGHO2_02_FULL_40_17]OGE04031.1 MAG: hypothetical protein A3F45_02760 [Candidatus Curtissbacteria bacterium RIFCSPHIGHO2_12_FULL_41_17]OGE08584.1 MAG: hypothetical protein A3I53_02325 [Candidatus Curtissbacteria bacterium RIFCSPLOWO2_02_FULL_40_13b]